MRRILQRVSGRSPEKGPAARPTNEAVRLNALRRYGVLDTLPEPVFDDLTRLAANICGTPVALITLVDEERLWFKSRVGLNLTETPRDTAPCAWTILGDDLLIVEDTRRDPRFAESPLVTGTPHIRFYAGMPLRTSDGLNIGTLCVTDAGKRRLSREQYEALRILAHQVMSQLELRRHLVELERSLFEQRRTQDALRDSEMFYQTLVESLPQNILRKDTKGRFVFANQKFCASLGKPLAQVLGKTDSDFFPRHLAEKYHRDDLRVMATREPIDTIEANQTPEGDRIFVHVIKTPLYDSAGNVVGIQGIFWDVTERKRTEEALAYERDLLRALLQNIPDRIYFKDVKSRFLRVSSSMARRLGGKDPSEIIGRTDFDFYPKELAEEFFADEQRIILTGQPLINKLERIVDHDGRESWASVTKVPLFNKAGGVTGIIGISRDVTKLKEAEVALEHARDAALETARIKSEFLANMSHEIRTPMNAIVGMTDLLLETALNQEQCEFVNTIRGSTDTLLAIINDILDFSKIEAGKLTFEIIDFDLRDLVESVVEMLAPRAQAKGLELACSLAEDVPTRLRGDPRRVGQVLTNLLSNAVKFTERGEVIVSVARRGGTDERPVVRLEVTDTGIGIPEKSLPLIFQAFTQADGSTTRKYGGTGLGLAISKQMIEQMNGTVGVQSVADKGSTFWFELPLEVQPEQAQPREAKTLHGSRVLVVDDNATTCQVISDHLRRWKLESQCVGDAAEALETLRAAANESRPFAVMVVDLQMPGLDGFTLARTVHGDPLLAPTKIVALAPLGQRMDEELMRRTGVAACVVKPVKQSRLYDALANAMEASAHAFAACVEARAEDSPAKITSAKPLTILLAEDNVVNQRVAMRQLQKLGYVAHAVNNGLEVLQETQRMAYDVILMDCQMPEMDGYEVTRRLRDWEKQFAARRVPAYIIAVTAHALEGDRERCLAAGMNDYITKPVHLAQLDAALNRAHRRRSAGGDPSPPVLDPVCLAGLRELREPGQPDPLIELFELFNRDADTCIERIQTGVSARNAREASQAAHGLKGSASNLGAPRLAGLCAEIEQHAKAEQWDEAGALTAQLSSELTRVRESLRAELLTA